MIQHKSITGDNFFVQDNNKFFSIIFHSELPQSLFSVFCKYKKKDVCVNEVALAKA